MNGAIMKILELHLKRHELSNEQIRCILYLGVLSPFITSRKSQDNVASILT